MKNPGARKAAMNKLRSLGHPIPENSDDRSIARAIHVYRLNHQGGYVGIGPRTQEESARVIMAWNEDRPIAPAAEVREFKPLTLPKQFQEALDKAKAYVHWKEKE